MTATDKTPKSDNEDDDGDLDDGNDEAVEIPAGARPTVEDDDDENEDEELEADLGEILKERLANDEEESDDEDRPTGLASKSGTTTQEKEITCQGCFLSIRASQVDQHSGDPTCPHCGAPVKI